MLLTIPKFVVKELVSSKKSCLIYLLMSYLCIIILLLNQISRII